MGNDQQLTQEQKDFATANYQNHLNKLVATFKKNEYELANEKDVPVSKILSLLKEQVEIDNAIKWIIDAEKRVTDSKIIPLKRTIR